MDGMDDSLYGEDSPKQDSSKQPPKDKSEDESMEPEALVDMKVLTGKDGPPKEGDEIVVKVVSIHGDQAVIQYAPEKPDKGKTSGESEPDEDDMEQLNSKY